MRVEGKLFVSGRSLQEAVVEGGGEGAGLARDLDACLRALCRELGIPHPVWLPKNTREFARFRQTVFFEGQFTEKVPFDRFQIRWL